MCTRKPPTLDYQLATRANYLEELKASIKQFDNSITQTMDSFRNLLGSFDSAAQCYGSVAGTFRESAREPVLAVREAMRNMKDKGPFGAFNNDMHAGAISVLIPVRREIKQLDKLLIDVRSAQKAYDESRIKISKTEQEYAKKGKPLSEKKGYTAEIVRRNECKEKMERKRAEFEHNVDALKEHVESAFTLSMNNYLRSVASMCGVLESAMNKYRTDTNDGKNVLAPQSALDTIKAEATAQSSQTQRATSANDSHDSAGNKAPAPLYGNGETKAK